MILENNKDITILEEEFPDFFHNLIRSLNYPINKNHLKVRTLIDWEEVSEAYEIPYYYEGCEEELMKIFRKSRIYDESLIIYIEFGPNEPMIKTTGKFFVENWDELIFNYGTMGSTIVSEDGIFLMEFTDDTNWSLFSNFQLPHAGASF